MLNPVGQFITELRVDGDAALLAVALLGFHDSMTAPGDGLIPISFVHSGCLPCRILGWDPDRYAKAFQILIENFEISFERDENGDGLGFKLAGWERFQKNSALYGQRVYWKLRKRAKKSTEATETVPVA